MARDLYGEMLSRALNRGAPQGHFAAYIQPGEAALLRSQGGGVAPGGGQYMANGLPTYIANPGGGRGGGGGRSPVNTSPVSVIGGGFLPGTPPAPDITGAPLPAPVLQLDPHAQANLNAEIAALTPANAEAQAQAQSHQRNMALQSQYMAANARAKAAQDAAVAAVQDAPGFQPTQDGMRDVIAAMQANRAPVDNATLQNINMNVILGDPNLSAADRSARLGAPISEGGIGHLSPGYSISTQSQPEGGMPVDQAIRTVQQRSPDGGYAILNPRPQLGQPVVSVPDGYTMGMGGGIIPAAINTAIGLGVPGLGGALIGAGNTLFGHTLGSMARDAIGSATEGTALGRLLAIPGQIRGEIGNVLSPITEGIGDALSGATTGLSNIFPDVAPPTSVPQAPPGVQPPAPEVAVDEEQSVPESEAEPFVRSYYEIPPEIAQRLAANVLYGEEQMGLA